MRDIEQAPKEPTYPDASDVTILSTETVRTPKPAMQISVENRIGTVEVMVGQSDEAAVSMNVTLAELDHEASDKELLGFYSTVKQVAGAAIEVALSRRHAVTAKDVVTSKTLKPRNTVVSMDETTNRIVITERTIT